MNEQQPGRVVIVDDDGDVCLSLQGILEKSGYLAQPFDNGDAALAYLVEQGADLVLTDIRMPGMDGMELLGNVLALNPDIPVILMTGYADLDVTVTAIKLGAFDFILKPYDPGYLLKTIEKGITYRRLRLAELQHRQDLEQAVEERTRQLQKAHALLLQNEKMALIGQIAAGIAHEINNPLGFISSNLETLSKFSERLLIFLALQSESLVKCCPAEELARIEEFRSKTHVSRMSDELPEIVQETLEGVERIKEIVRNLKGFARVDDHELFVSNINEIIDKALTIVRNELKYVATIITEYGDLPPIQCHPNQLAQVFMNLLVNAAHAIEEHGDIHVRTWREGEWLYAAVSDSGCGIPAENLPRIFEPFFTTKDVGKGTGLGLSISYDIIRKHHGEITVESEVGKGTVFTIMLPVK